MKHVFEGSSIGDYRDSVDWAIYVHLHLSPNEGTEPSVRAYFRVGTRGADWIDLQITATISFPREGEVSIGNIQFNHGVLPIIFQTLENYEQGLRLSQEEAEELTQDLQEALEEAARIAEWAYQEGRWGIDWAW
jgi:hypothetical protein